MNHDARPYYPVAGELITDNALSTLIPEGYSPQETTLLFVHAHPDDEASSTGATIGALTAAGATVHLLTMTRGEMGEVIDPALPTGAMPSASTVPGNSRPPSKPSASTTTSTWEKGPATCPVNAPAIAIPV